MSFMSRLLHEQFKWYNCTTADNMEEHCNKNDKKRNHLKPKLTPTITRASLYQKLSVLE